VVKVFKNLINRKSKDSDVENSQILKNNEVKYSKTFEVELSNMEGSPLYSLTHQLTVGSEIGNIIISDPSISPRHATILLQEEVISIIDHASVTGTKINGKKIDSGKNIILDENDRIQLGDLELKIKTNVVEEVEESIPQPPLESKDHHAQTDEGKNPEVAEDPEAEETFEDEDPFQKSQKKILTLKKTAEKNKRPSHKLVLSAPTNSANAVIRVLSVFCDFLLAYIIFSIFSPFDDFRMFIDFIPDFFQGLFWESGSYLWSIIISEVPILEEIRKFLFEVFTELINFSFVDVDVIALVVLYGIIRFFSTLFFGISLSEFFLGVRSEGHPIWSRLGGIIRVMLGLITFPLFIFDLPAIFSRRTFKELVTFTNIIIPSAFLSILGIIFYIPTLFLILLFSPLIQGLEFPKEIKLNTKIDLIPLPSKNNQEVALNSGASQNLILFDSSEKLGFGFSYSSDELLIIPDFQFKGSKKKLILKSGLVFYQRSLKDSVEFEVYKNYNLQQLLGIAIKGNFFLYDKYPKIYDYVYRPNALSMSFKKERSVRDEASFANEVIKLFATSFSLNVFNSLDIFQEETLFIKGLIELRSSLLGLLGQNEFKSIGFIKMGDAIFMKFSVDHARPYDLLIPLVMDHGKIYKVTYSKNETKENSSSLLYRSYFKKSYWINPAKRNKSETMTAFEIHDLFSNPDFNALFKEQGSAKALYGYLFETSGAVFKQGDELELLIWKNNLQKLVNLLEILPDPQIPEGQENLKLTLIQNVRALMDAVDNKNASYFGITPNPENPNPENL
jgi:hypothetical protein